MIVEVSFSADVLLGVEFVVVAVTFSVDVLLIKGEKTVVVLGLVLLTLTGPVDVDLFVFPSGQKFTVKFTFGPHR